MMRELFAAETIFLVVKFVYSGHKEFGRAQYSGNTRYI